MMIMILNGPTRNRTVGVPAGRRPMSVRDVEPRDARPGESAQRPPFLLVPTLALVTTITALVSSLGAPLVPLIATDLDVRLEDAQWTLTAALLAGAVSTPIVGRLGSGRLRKPTIIAGLALVLVGTVVAAIPAGLATLVTGRALQGVGLALVPLALAVARDVVPADRIPATIGFLSVTTVAGAGLGYPFTAQVADAWGLPAAFLAGAALTTLSLVLVVAVVPSNRGEASARVDWRGAALVSIGMLGVLLGVSRGQTWGWLSPPTVVLSIVGALFLAVFVRHTLKSADPLMDLRLALRPGLMGPNLVALAAGFGMYSLLTLMMVLVQAPGWGLGEPPIVAGLTLVPYSIASVLGNRFARAVARRVGDQVLLPAGCVLFLCADLGLIVWHDDISWVLGWMALAGMGSGFTFSSLAPLMIPHLPRRETGSAIALNQVLRYLGFTLGSASSVALMIAIGGAPGEVGFRRSLLVSSAVWVMAAIGSWHVGRRATRDQKC